jgi:hypothetical protein
MPTIELDDQELGIVMDNIANTMPWIRANPILAKLTKQLQQHQQMKQPDNVGEAILRGMGQKQNGPEAKP